MTSTSSRFIVCGASEISQHLIEELLHQETGTIIVIDLSSERLGKISAISDRIVTIEGDATDDDTLKSASIETATGVFIALPDDKSTLFACLAARQLVAGVKIIAVANDLEKSGAKLTRAGANVIISPGMLGGLRMASEVARPAATRLLDKLMRSNPHELRLLEIEVMRNSKADNHSIGELNIREKTGLGIIAVIKKNETLPIYNPGATLVIREGDKLVAMGGDKEEMIIKKLTLG